MKNILSAEQMREADRYTILTRNITSLDLMEAASRAFVAEFCRAYEDTNRRIAVFCGNGNNGGDGLAIARLLAAKSYAHVEVHLIRIAENNTADYQTNLRRLADTGIPVYEAGPECNIPHDAIIIEALLGSGLNRPVAGSLKELIEKINSKGLHVVSVDVPGGLASDGRIDPATVCVQSELVISFQRPKLSFFFPESGQALRQFKVVDIGLDERFIEEMPSAWKLVERIDIAAMLRPRKRFSHKGTYGHALIVAGSTISMGAALLCSEACLNTGAGLVSAAIPGSGLTALNTRLPEAMFVPRNGAIDWNRYDAIAIGPGLGIAGESRRLLEEVCACGKPFVADADVFSLLASSPGLLKRIPAGTVMTPHMKEFDRVFGSHASWFARIETAREHAARRDWIIVLKNQYTFIVLPEGDVLINPTGNPAMATGGMGDVLTGIITSLLAQGYSPSEAAIIGCFLHGEAGDELKGDGSAIIRPSELCRKLPFTQLKLKGKS